MPQYRNPFDKGDLYVKFDVQFPHNHWISPEKLVVRHVTHHFVFCSFAASSLSSFNSVSLPNAGAGGHVAFAIGAAHHHCGHGRG